MAKSEKTLDSMIEIDENLSPHQMIAMLLEGALTRIDEAVVRIHEKDIDAAAQCVIKTIRIVEGLRENLNMEAEGEIATNLHNLYSYISERLRLITTEEPLGTLEEVKVLLNNIQEGWLGIEAQVNQPLAAKHSVQAAAHMTP